MNSLSIILVLDVNGEQSTWVTNSTIFVVTVLGLQYDIQVKMVTKSIRTQIYNPFRILPPADAYTIDTSIIWCVAACSIKKLSASDSRKGQTAPAELWHEADSVSRRHRRAVPAGTLAQRTGGPEQSVSQGQIHPGQLRMKNAPSVWI